MRLVFVHGWGFDATFWDGLSAALPDFPQARVELGFLGQVPAWPDFQPDDVLIGHSLGFLWGVQQYRLWRAAIAINGFACFAGGTGACVALAVLRAMRVSLARDPKKTLENFYRSFGHAAELAGIDVARLMEGLLLLEASLVECPAGSRLILASRKDRLVPPAASEHLATVLNNAPIRWQEEGEHLLPLTQSLWCAEAIRAFLS